MFGLNPWGLFGAALFFIAAVGGAFFYGQHVGAAEIKAGLLDTQSKDFKKYVGDVKDAASQGTKQALQDFADRTAVLDRISNQLSTAQGVMTNAASKLSASMRGGSCVLGPEQRRLLECIRRPGDPGCAAPGH